MGVANIMAMLALFGMIFYKVEGKLQYYDFVLSENNFTRLCSTKAAMVVNESIPGPVIYVNKGDTIYVNVHNRGGFKVTIHWHGVKQPRNSWHDGPEYITQCAIQPGTNFTYEVNFSNEEGTLWWHAHNEWTRNTVHGAIVVYPKENTSYPFSKPDAEEILILGSWYTYDVNLVVEDDLEEKRTNFPESDAYTINGQPGDFCNCSKESTFRWQVDYGKTYLLRIVNAIMSAEMVLAIAEHNLTVVGMDGSYLKPFVTAYIMIAPGQTMDILLTTNQSPGRYYIAARQHYTGGIGFTGYDQTNVTAILEYNGNYTQNSPIFPFKTLPAYTDYASGLNFTYKLKSLYRRNVPKNITTRMFITASMNYLSSGDEPNYAASLNNISWVNQKMDVLHAYYYNVSGFYTEDFPDKPSTFYDFVGDDIPLSYENAALATKVKVLEYGEEVEVVFQSSNIMNGSSDHPMHLHGHSFYVVGFGVGNFDFEEDPKAYNLFDPPFINTATLPKVGWVAIRFKALNPGVWLWHCHFDHHLTWGMNFVIIVKNGGTLETSLRDPPPYMPPCDDAPIIKIWKHEPSYLNKEEGVNTRV